ncbi:alginate lyase family protein [Aestuariivivens insulae]|uniref:alginate lyase family protein n=1 Tax=Aestuariivivens insulae TaxID=1621988 RepID=UPI001F55C333|nr:alginate lyase family protein [Aestuariivivens insulae]
MKNKLVLLLQIILLTLLALHSNAQVASDQQANEVKAEIVKFKNNWKEKLPYDSKFGIIQITQWLNLDYPGLEKVKDAVDVENWERAENTLLTYFKDKYKDFKPSVKALTNIEVEASESALNHYFRGNKDAHPLIYRGANIDWISPAFYNGKEIKDKEWQFIFQRLLWWEALAKAFYLTKDEKYYDEWHYEMVDNATDLLPIANDAPQHIKRGMETYNRCERLKNVLPYFINEKQFDSKTLLYFLYSFYVNAEHIRTVYADKGNHLLGELITVFENGVTFPEFKKSKEWVDETITRIPERMFTDIYPDGMNKELIFSYHSMYLRIFTDAYMAFKKHAYDSYLPNDYLNRLTKMAEIYAYHMFPDNTISQFGDAWKHRDAADIYTKNVSRFAPETPYLKFIATKGKEGTPPPKTSVAYPLSGFYFFRSHWEPDAVFMSMKNNSKYSWHSQIDNGTFEFYAYGRNFMIDSGAYIYNSDDPEEQNWRKWFRGSVAHQTLTLNNEDIKIDSKHIFWKESDKLVILVNENSSYDNLTHRRTTLFIDNSYFLIYDQAISDAVGDVRAHFQLVPCPVTIDKNTLTVSTDFEEGANLIVKNFPTTNSVTLEKEEGWISYDILRKEERPAWGYSYQKTDKDKEVEFLTALVPYKENNKPTELKSTVVTQKDNLIFTLNVDDKTYKVKMNIAEKTAKLIKAD